MPDLIRRSPEIDKAILDYVLSVSDSSQGWWDQNIEGTPHSMRDQFKEYRLRYKARRSIAQLYQDAKNEPFPRSSNIGIGLESIFGEFLIPTFISNTHELDPPLQAVDERTEQVDDTLTKFHSEYQKSPELGKRQLLELSNREVLKVGGVFHKWVWGSNWRQIEKPVWVLFHPELNQPLFKMNEQTGMPEPIPADPAMPKDMLPEIPGTGKRAKVGKLPGVEQRLVHEGPRLTIRKYEDIDFPPNTTSVDPNDWDYVIDNMTKPPWYFLGREGDPFQGKLQNLDKLWKHLGIDPNNIAKNPDKRLNKGIKLKEAHFKFPVTNSGKPVEIVALIAPEFKLNLGWQMSRLPRRPFTNRQVWTREDSPLGVGIPESIWGLRNALDAMLNQDLDAGNMYNHPPMVISSLAMIDDEDYETTGPGTQWIMQDINGAKFLPPPISKRDPIAMLNWLVSMTQRIWGVTDLNLNAPSESLSPNVSTATGTMAVLNQGNIKFGHLTKRLAEIDSIEYDLNHEMFRSMLSNPRLISVKGEPVEVKPQDREQFFNSHTRIKAIGNGVSTNPSTRQQVLTQLFPILAQHPILANDMEFQRDYLQQIIDTAGIELEIKDSAQLQFMQMITQLMQTPIGQQKITQAVQESSQAIQLLQSVGGQGQPQGANGNGATTR